jgi:hypothetical protein
MGSISFYSVGVILNAVQGKLLQSFLFLLFVPPVSLEVIQRGMPTA